MPTRRGIDIPARKRETLVRLGMDREDIASSPGSSPIICGLSVGALELSMSAMACVETNRKVPAENKRAIPAEMEISCWIVVTKLIWKNYLLQNSSFPRILPPNIPSILPSSSAFSSILSLQLATVMILSIIQVMRAPKGVAREKTIRARFIWVYWSLDDKPFEYDRSRMEREKATGALCMTSDMNITKESPADSPSVFPDIC